MRDTLALALIRAELCQAEARASRIAPGAAKLDLQNGTASFARLIGLIGWRRNVPELGGPRGHMGAEKASSPPD